MVALGREIDLLREVVVVGHGAGLSLCGASGVRPRYGRGGGEGRERQGDACRGLTRRRERDEGTKVTKVTRAMRRRGAEVGNGLRGWGREGRRELSSGAPCAGDRPTSIACVRAWSEGGTDELRAGCDAVVDGQRDGCGEERGRDVLGGGCR